MPVCGHRAWWDCFGPALYPNPVRNRRFPDASLKLSGPFEFRRDYSPASPLSSRLLKALSTPGFAAAVGSSHEAPAPSGGAAAALLTSSDIHGPLPHKFVGFGDIHRFKSCKKFVGFGDIHGPKSDNFTVQSFPGICFQTLARYSFSVKNTIRQFNGFVFRVFPCLVLCCSMIF